MDPGFEESPLGRERITAPDHRRRRLKAKFSSGSFERRLVLDCKLGACRCLVLLERTWEAVRSFL
jgi:hypothetical protein